MKLLPSMENKFPCRLFKREGNTVTRGANTRMLSVLPKARNSMLRSVEKQTRRFGLAFMIGGLVWMTSATAFAADFDGSKAVICATVAAMDCVSGEKCTKGSADDMGAPEFLQIDFANKTIGGPTRTTPIVSMDTGENQVLMQGKEQGYGWTLALDQVKGKFSATLVNRDGVFLLFGSCTPS